MGPVYAFLLLVAGLAVIGSALAFGAHILDQRSLGAMASKKRVKKLEAALREVEDLARDTLLVNPSDVTAHQVCDVINRTRRAL